ncbi:MAG: 7-cyano-7-deazaguanine synthase QueC [Planctomycetota bacterium]|jgi:7-cyano-7-deazaguanine synthase
MHKAVALLSGGLDSSVALAAAKRRHRVVLAVTFDYGQRAARREVAAARAIARALKVPHRVIALPWLKAATKTALVNRKRKLPRRGAAAVWVPNRNGVFLNICAALAEDLGATRIVAGFNLEEAAAFPDNSTAFIRAANRAFAYSTRIRVKVVSPVARMKKAAIARLGRKLGVPLEKTWSCYAGGRRPCGKCEPCRRKT